ncbi:transposase [Martelella mediterranea]|nr:transposase [Martelella mediterranea]
MRRTDSASVRGRHQRPGFRHLCLNPACPDAFNGDVVVWDNLNVYKSPRAAEAIRARGGWVLFLPRYSPDMNPIEKAFSKLKALLRKTKAQT